MIENEKLYLYIGDKLAAERKERRLSQTLVATKLGITRASVSNIERGVQKPPIHLVYQYCDLINLDIEDVMPRLDEVRSSQSSIARNVKELNLDLDLPRSVANVIRNIDKEID